MIQTGLMKLGGGGGQFNSQVVKDTPELLVDQLVPVVQLGPAVPGKRKVIRNCCVQHAVFKVFSSFPLTPSPLSPLLPFCPGSPCSPCEDKPKAETFIVKP